MPNDELDDHDENSDLKCLVVNENETLYASPSLKKFAQNQVAASHAHVHAVAVSSTSTTSSSKREKLFHECCCSADKLFTCKICLNKFSENACQESSPIGGDGGGIDINNNNKLFQIEACKCKFCVNVSGFLTKLDWRSKVILSSFLFFLLFRSSMIKIQNFQLFKKNLEKSNRILTWQIT